ncbi:hypothetical protein KSS87_014380 [Heliosperma pusillum]|nr:hypothetical protein KSS87_014380 [Heliosperma pusillum]
MTDELRKEKMSFDQRREGVEDKGEEREGVREDQCRTNDKGRGESYGGENGVTVFPFKIFLCQKDFIFLCRRDLGPRVDSFHVEALDVPAAGHRHEFEMIINMNHRPSLEHTRLRVNFVNYESSAKKSPRKIDTEVTDIFIASRNYPLLMATWKVGPALAAGCTAVLKPSELASVTCLELAEVCREMGLPPGVLNILTGLGPDAGAPIASHPGVDKVAFTGSTATGSKIMSSAAQLVKPVTLELGGKSPLVVFDDVDLDQAAEWTAFGCFWTNGQICSATSRLILHENIAADFLDRLVKWVKNIKNSSPFEEGCRMGPVINQGQYEKVLKFVSIAKSEGATVLCGGARLEGYWLNIDLLNDAKLLCWKCVLKLNIQYEFLQHLTKGYFVEPTIITDVTTSIQIWREEVFGPVLCVKTFSSEDEAIELANDTQYGLGAAVISKDLDRGKLFSWVRVRGSDKEGGKEKRMMGSDEGQQRRKIKSTRRIKGKRRKARWRRKREIKEESVARGSRRTMKKSREKKRGREIVIMQ